MWGHAEVIHNTTLRSQKMPVYPLKHPHMPSRQLPPGEHDMSAQLHRAVPDESTRDGLQPYTCVCIVEGVRVHEGNCARLRSTQLDSE